MKLPSFCVNHPHKTTRKTGLTLPGVALRIRAVTQRLEDQKFLRAAIKAGLRMQRSGSSDGGGQKSEGVATLQRIKASLRKRNSNSKASS